MKWMTSLACALALAAAPASAAEFGKPGMAGVRIAVKDDARSILFYKTLGMEVGRLYHPGQQEMKWPDPNAGPALVLISDGKSTQLVPGTVSFMVFSADVPATIAALRAAGFTAPDIKPGQTPYVELAFPDPDGNTILLIGPRPK
jgi:catechol 2,3-dioxygenase-like lactoylglutathione lyase family enzyme